MDEILRYLEPYHKILLGGCGACVTVCHAGGEKEVGLLASGLRMARKKIGKPLEVLEATPARQCEPEFALELADTVGKVEAVVSIACGVGVQTLVRHFPKTGFPGVNTTFWARPSRTASGKNGASLGNCILERTEEFVPCPAAPSSLSTAPCGVPPKGNAKSNERLIVPGN
jgi:hypothetical protein